MILFGGHKEKESGFIYMDVITGEAVILYGCYKERESDVIWECECLCWHYLPESVWYECEY